MAGLTQTDKPAAETTAKPVQRRAGHVMAKPSVPLGRILGIPINLDYSWFLIVGLLTWMLASNYYPGEFKGWSPLEYWVTGAATALLLFGSVVLHELGHAVVAMRFKIPVRSITLFIFGGVAQIGAEPLSAKAEFLIAIAGPAVSLTLAMLLTALRPVLVSIQPLFGIAEYLAYINFALVVFNLIPGYPLDGGRVFRAAIWAVTKNAKQSTLIAANAGRLFGFLFIVLGVFRTFSGDLGGLWIAFIGWFLENAAAAQVHQVAFQGLLAGHTVSQAMSTQCPIVPHDMTLQQLVDEHVLGSGRRCFLVNRGPDTLGLMTLHRIKEVPRTEWPQTTTAEVMIPMNELKRIGPATDLWVALEFLNRDGVNQLPVMTDNRVVGMLSRDDVISFLGTMQELGDPAPRRRVA